MKILELIFMTTILIIFTDAQLQEVLQMAARQLFLQMIFV